MLARKASLFFTQLTLENRMRLSIEHTSNPGVMFHRHAEQLSIVGASAFGRDVEAFAPQVKEHFEGAKLAQIMKVGKDVVGFALYDILRSSVWRRANAGRTGAEV
jgi:hypothetical protein